jgi:hypothetical protein
MMGERFFSEVFTHVGQWGTHVDPSAHFHKGLRTVDQIELKEMDPAARVHRRSGAMGTLLLDSEGASTHSGPPSPERRRMYDVKPGRATICLPLLPEDKNMLNAMLAKTVAVWMRPSAVVKDMLGQLTESRGRNEDRL